MSVATVLCLSILSVTFSLANGMEDISEKNLSESKRRVERGDFKTAKYFVNVACDNVLHPFKHYFYLLNSCFMVKLIF